jgi:uncharacterized protein YndB with AHSA1/START domain
MAESRGTVFVAAGREAVYRACIDPVALAVWRAPGEMTAVVLEHAARVGGGYRMSLFYPETEAERGKSGGREDRFTGRYLELDPPAKIVEAIRFDSAAAAFAGELIMTTTLTERPGGTDVTITFQHLPAGVRPEDNDEGTRQSLAKLKCYVEHHPG